VGGNTLLGFLGDGKASSVRSLKWGQCSCIHSQYRVHTASKTNTRAHLWYQG